MTKLHIPSRYTHTSGHTPLRHLIASFQQHSNELRMVRAAVQFTHWEIGQTERKLAAVCLKSAEASQINRSEKGQLLCLIGHDHSVWNYTLQCIAAHSLTLSLARSPLHPNSLCWSLWELTEPLDEHRWSVITVRFQLVIGEEVCHIFSHSDESVLGCTEDKVDHYLFEMYTGSFFLTLCGCVCVIVKFVQSMC